MIWAPSVEINASRETRDTAGYAQRLFERRWPRYPKGDAQHPDPYFPLGSLVHHPSKKALPEQPATLHNTLKTHSSGEERYSAIASIDDSGEGPKFNFEDVGACVGTGTRSQLLLGTVTCAAPISKVRRIGPSAAP